MATRKGLGKLKSHYCGPFSIFLRVLKFSPDFWIFFGGGSQGNKELPLKILNFLSRGSFTPTPHAKKPFFVTTTSAAPLQQRDGNPFNSNGDFSEKKRERDGRKSVGGIWLGPTHYYYFGEVFA